MSRPPRSPSRLAPARIAALLVAAAPALSGALASCASGEDAPASGGSGPGQGGGSGGCAEACGPDSGDPGCTQASDCAAPLVCNLGTHQCVACFEDSHCPAGAVCGPAGECVPGCSPGHGCEGALACCGEACVDLQTDAANCGGCGEACAGSPHAASGCVAGLCALIACEAGFADCNQSWTDGCEHDLAEGPCACAPGQTQSCYQGPPGTEGVGACAAGVTTCLPSGAGWSGCVGQTTPVFDLCADGVDNDCDGTVDNTPDQDDDGFTKCDGDCCDAMSDGCGDPELVNPGAFEVAGNTVDDDCDGAIDNVLGACDAGLASNSSTALDYARAIDLCATTVESPPSLAQKKWGVISAALHRANGSGAPAAASRSIRQGFGSGVTPLQGARMAVLSTGVAAAQAAPNHTNPGFAAFQGGQDMSTSSPVPADWLAANGNNFPNAPGCPEPQGGTTANDPVMLKLRVRAPTNAGSFSVSTFFYASEYPEWVCSPFNDFFLALLDSAFVPAGGQAPNPADKNLAFYDAPPAGGPIHPVGVNLAFGNTGLFTQCQNGPTGCGSGAVAGTTSTCTGMGQLSGTGFDAQNPPSQYPGDPGWCGQSNRTGGGTGWLITSGNVAPGETIELRFVLWDTGDHWYDSLVILDNFQWSVNASTPGTYK